MRLSRRFEPFVVDLDPLPDLRSTDSLMREVSQADIMMPGSPATDSFFRPFSTRMSSIRNSVHLK